MKIFDYPGPLWRVYSLAAQIILVASVIAWGPVILTFILLRTPPRMQTWSIRVWLAFTMRLFRIRVHVQGENHFDPQRPTLLVSNHQSLFDIPIIYRLFAGEIRMVAKKELFSVPIFGQVISSAGMIPIDRGNRASGQAASALIRERIHAGTHVWVAPEGTRSRDGSLGHFKKGSFAIAIESQIPIQPVLIENSIDSLPKNTLMVRPGITVKVQVMPQIPTVGMSINDRGKVAGELETLMRARLAAVTH